MLKNIKVIVKGSVPKLLLFWGILFYPFEFRYRPLVKSVNILRGSICVHLIDGFPSCPFGQKQIGLCILALHLAVGAQTAAISHGFWQ